MKKSKQVNSKKACAAVVATILTASVGMPFLRIYQQHVHAQTQVFTNQSIQLTDGSTLNFDAVNKNRATNQLVVYTTAWGQPTSGQNEWGIELVINENGEVIGKTEPGTKVDDNIIPENGYVLSAHGDARAKLAPIQVGATLTFTGFYVKEETKILQSQQLGLGIQHQELAIDNHNQNQGIQQRVNVVTADLTNENVEVITSKAQERVVAKETLSEQMRRAEYAGHNVVAGITGDMFNADTGLNMTMQIQNGKALINHNYPSHVQQFPVFGITDQKEAFIDTVALKGTLLINQQTVQIDTLNRNEALDNKLGVFTPKMLANREFKVPQQYVDTGAIAIVRGIKNADAIQIGETYTGIVEIVKTTANTIQIPADAIVVAGFGTQKAVIEQLTVGQEVSVTWNAYRGDQLANNIVHATGGYTQLVANGEALTASEMLANGASSSLVETPNARAAVGITAEGKVIALTADKSSATFNEATGMTLPDLAQLLVEQGAVTAINLDGGGSAQLSIQPQGSHQIEVANHPSDGNERALTNAILFTTTASASAQLGAIQLNKPITIFKGASFAFEAKLTDTNGHPYELINESLKWETTAGTISDQGVLQATEVGEQTVTVTAQGVTAQVPVRVVDSVDSFTFQDAGPVSLVQGEQKQFALKAKAASEEVILTPEAIQWAVTPAVGTFATDGTFTVAETTENGTSATVTAAIGELTQSIGILVGMENIVIDDFEGGDISNYGTNKNYVSSYDIFASDEQAKSGTTSLKLEYDYSGWTTGNGAMYVIPKEKPSVDIQPKALGMWVYGDGKAPWLRGQLITADGSKKTVDFAKQVDWIGWKYVEIPVDSSWEAPLSLNYIYSVETNKALMGNPERSAIYIDDIQWVYTDGFDLIGPTFSQILPTQGTIYEQDFTIGATVSDDLSGVNPETIEVKVDDRVVSHMFDQETGQIRVELKNVAAGKHKFTITAADFANNQALPAVDRTFTVDLSADTKAPELIDYGFSHDVASPTATPRIDFHFQDFHSGLDAKSLAVTVDGQAYDAYFDETNGRGYVITEPLANGSHKYSIQISDQAGNQTSQKTVEFEVKAIEQPTTDAFNITVIPDTQGFTYSQDLFTLAQEQSSDLVIHMGDIVEQETPEEWQQVQEDLKLIDKPFLITPGNHESFKGTLTNYEATFGEATYHLEYGNTLIVSLNTAFGQGISESDPTQFHYLETILSQTAADNVLVVTHVPTQDTYGTKHEMSPADATRFKAILSNYKQANQEKDIQVVFGHEHWLETWEEDGVQYAVTGNGAQKKYVSYDQGAIHGLGNVTITQDGIEYGFDPFLTTVSLNEFAIQEQTLRIGPDSQKQLTLQGDFRENNMNYITNLMNQDDVNMTFTTSNAFVASVDDNGLLKTHQPGTATIEAQSGNQSYVLTVEVLPSTDIAVKSIFAEFVVMPIIEVGTRIPISVTGIDANNQRFAIDPTIVNWSSSDENIGFVENGAFVAQAGGTTVLAYEYQGFTGTLEVTVDEQILVPTPDVPTGPVAPSPDEGGNVTPEVDAEADDGFGPDGNVTPEVDAEADGGFGPDGNVTPEVKPEEQRPFLPNTGEQIQAMSLMLGIATATIGSVVLSKKRKN